MQPTAAVQVVQILLHGSANINWNYTCTVILNFSEFSIFRKYRSLNDTVVK